LGLKNSDFLQGKHYALIIYAQNRGATKEQLQELEQGISSSFPKIELKKLPYTAIYTAQMFAKMGRSDFEECLESYMTRWRDFPSVKFSPEDGKINFVLKDLDMETTIDKLFELPNI